MWVKLINEDISVKSILACFELELFYSISHQSTCSEYQTIEKIKTTWG